LHLSGDRVKKQATIFGASCIEHAWLMRSKENQDVTTSPLKFWRDDDFKNCDSDEETKKQTKKQARTFNAFIEDWEKEAIRKRDVVNETKILKKYGGLTWQDINNDDVVLYSDCNMLHWSRLTKNGGGYCIIARDPEYREDDPGNHKHTEPWEITQDLIGQIAASYTEHKNEGVRVEYQSVQDNEAGTTHNDNIDSDHSNTDSE